MRKVMKLRRASHLKVYDPKEKVTAMVPRHDKDNCFGRSTKLLLHVKDVPVLQFTSKTEGEDEISPDTEVSVVEWSIDSNKQKNVSSSNLIESCGEICTKTKD